MGESNGTSAHSPRYAAALVHGDELGQQVVVYLRVPLDGLALVEADPEAVDQLALIAQGLGGVDDALGHAASSGR